MSILKASIGALFFAAISLLAAPLHASSLQTAPDILFGPQAYERSAGPVRTLSNEFTASQSQLLSDMCQLHVEQSEQSSERVTSARIRLNGRQLLGPGDFNPRVGDLSKPVQLAATNQLSVALSGRPGTWLTLTVDCPYNHPPLADAGADLRVMPGQLARLDASRSSDLDGDLLRFDWELISWPWNSQTQLNNVDQVRPELYIDQPGDYLAELRVSDSRDESEFSQVLLSTDNVPPVADAGVDLTTPAGQEVRLDATGSTDVDGDRLLFHWSLQEKPESSNAELASDSGLFTRFLVDQPGDYEVELLVSDGLSDSRPSRVRISTDNSPPQAIAGPDQRAVPDQWVVLDGSASRDADGDELSYFWSFTALPENSMARLSDAYGVDPDFQVDQPGTYVVQLIVNDGQSDSAPDHVVISTQNSRPVAQIEHPPELYVGDRALLHGDQSFDADADLLQYRWSLLVQPEASQTTFDDDTSVNPRLELDRAGDYLVQLQVSDGKLTSTPVTALLTTLNSPPLARISVPAGPLPVGEPIPLDGARSQDPDDDPLNFIWELSEQPAGSHAQLEGADSPQAVFTPDLPGDYLVRLWVSDHEYQSVPAQVLITVEPASDLPPDPVTVAPALDPTIATTTFSATRFLFSGDNPIQRDAEEGAITPEQIAVLRGRVLDRQQNPLTGVQISVKDRPQFGHTISRADGAFDLAANGGGYLTLRYEREGYLPVQRQIKTHWQDYHRLPDVVMVPLDKQVTHIDLSADLPIQTARGSVVHDDDGTRRATLLFPRGTQAWMILPDGSEQPLMALDVRATEYTVGENGPLAMPGELPSGSAYTYAVELSVDEAIVRGAREVQFDRPIPVYVENFLSFPVGSIVPSGWYDFDKGAWVPSDNGQVVSILSINSGLAELDLNGSGSPASTDALTVLGISEDERRELAQLYTPGQSLWRVPVTHFTPWDYNWPYGPPSGAVRPDLSQLATDQSQSDPTIECGSVIECENQVLGQTLPVVGTPLTLNYRSDRVPGRVSANTLTVPLSTANLPSSLKRIDLEIQVAGQYHNYSFPALPNQSHEFVWDGKDGYGRTVQGVQPVTIRIGYVYQLVYHTPVNFRRSFAQLGGGPIAADRGRGEVALWQELTRSIGTFDARMLGVGGWSLDLHHAFYPSIETLFRGDGSKHVALDYDHVTVTLAGNGGTTNTGDGGPALNASLKGPYDVAVAPDGTFYLAVEDSVRKIDPQGVITTIPGTEGRSGILNLALGHDGSVYFTQQKNTQPRIFRITPDGSVVHFAGNGIRGFSGDGGPAVSASFTDLRGMAAAPDGSLYITDFRMHRVRRVGPDGIIHTVVGDGRSGIRGVGGNAQQASVDRLYDVALGPDGDLYVVSHNHTIFRVGADGILRRAAGGCNGFRGDGGPATSACMGRVSSVSVRQDGAFVIADIIDNRRARMVNPQGRINTIAGHGGTSLTGDRGPSTNTSIGGNYLSFGPDQNLYVADYYNRRLRRVGSALGAYNSALQTAISRDGLERYGFDQDGRHIRTEDNITGALLHTLEYDDHGWLIRITDGDNNITLIERDSQGNPLAIIAPDGQRTELALDSNGFLTQVTNPAGEAHSISYTSDGLLTAFTKPRGNTSHYSYDSLGRLVKTENSLGGGWQLARSEQPKQYQSSLTSAEGRTTVYHSETLSNGNRLRRSSYPDGTTETVQIRSNGERLTTRADGSQTLLREGPDPRFGMNSPVPELFRLTLPSGLAAEMTTQRQAILDNPGNLLSHSQLSTTTRINGRTATSTYTTADRTWRMVSPAGRQQQVKVDTQGRPLDITRPGLASIEMAYDTRGRLQMIRQLAGAESRETHLDYGSDGFLHSLTDSLDRSVQLSHDPVGRLRQQIRPDGESISFDYDSNGNLSALTPVDRPAHEFDHNTVDRPDRYAPPSVFGSLSTDTLYEYNLDQQLTRVTRADDRTLDYHYDTAGRLSHLALERGEYRYHYRAATGQLQEIESPQGLLLSYTYDGPLLTQTTLDGPVSGSIDVRYDNDLRPERLRVNQADPIHFQYEADSLLTQAGDLNLIYGIDHGLLLSTELHAVNDHYTYNPFAEVTDYRVEAGSNTLLQIAYERDALGRITRKTEQLGVATQTYDYQYDLLGRLESVQRNGVPAAEYQYDANGNRLSRTAMGVTETAEYDAQDRLLSYGSAISGTTYQYTAHGELSSKNQSGLITGYDYDELGNLMQVALPNGQLIDYLIDGQNRRVGKQRNGVLERAWLYQDQLNPIAEFDGQGNLINRFVYADRGHVPAYLIRDGETYRYITDHLGSVRLLVNTQTGAIAQRIDYDEFGRVLSDSQPGFQPFGFAGGLYDRDTGLVRFGARDYDPQTGRWTSKDPIGFSGGDANLYGYVGNDPVNFVDPTGLVTVVVYVTGLPPHSALFITGEGRTPFLYDPAGTYRPSIGAQRGSGDFFEGESVNFSDYVDYHTGRGDTVMMYPIPTTLGQEMEIIDRAVGIGGVTSGYCASAVSGALGGACGVESSFWPSSLYDNARNAQCK